MSNIHQDINDDEIRIISSNSTEAVSSPSKPTLRRLIIASIILAFIVVGVITAIIWINRKESNSELSTVIRHDKSESTYCAVKPSSAEREVNFDISTPSNETSAIGYVFVNDTIVESVGLSIFKPEGLTPTLHVGTDVLNDTTVKFIVQAADVRKDNGGIVGAFVQNGELLSKGQAKSGFCAIIGGKMNIGVAEATPYLEQALESNGYFFRQYPLVVANQVVENKPKGESLRKALAELNGDMVVIMSKKPMTFHNFSQSLVDLGVSNAIYLVGSYSNGFAVCPDGRKIIFGKLNERLPANSNYIVWR